MKLAALAPRWLKDVRRAARDTRDIERALSDHSATLRGLTVLLEQEIEDLRTEARTQ